MLGILLRIDVGAFEKNPADVAQDDGLALATASPRGWAPPAADGNLPGVIPATFEVKVLATESGPTLVAAIELVSPGNKDRPLERRAFAARCASYLYQRISVIVIDIVTSRRAILHNELLRLMETNGSLDLVPENYLYAVAYRPLRRGGSAEIDVWLSVLGLGKSLPTLPLGLCADLAIPVDFEAPYAEACRRKRLTG